MMVVPVRSRPEFKPGAPRVLFEKALKSGVYDSLSYDVTADGREFLMIERRLDLAPNQMINKIQIRCNAVCSGVVITLGDFLIRLTFLLAVESSHLLGENVIHQ